MVVEREKEAIENGFTRCRGDDVACRWEEGGFDRARLLTGQGAGVMKLRSKDEST